MKLIAINKITDKTKFNNYNDWNKYPIANLRCPNCKSNVKIKYKNLEKHADGELTNLSESQILQIDSFIKEQKIDKPNSFLGYNCPYCKNLIRIYYDYWVGGRHGEAGFDLKFGIVEHCELVDWRISFEEQSNNVWVYKMIHESGAMVEKTGTDLDQLLRDTRIDVIRMNEQLKEK